MKNAKMAKGVFCGLFSGACWGFSGTVGQYLFSQKQMDPNWLTVVRMLISGGILLSVAAVKKDPGLREIWKERKSAVSLLLFAVFGLMMVQYSYMMTISQSNSGTATALQYLGQALILLFVCISGRRMPTVRELLALLFAMAGVFLLTTHGKPGNLALSPNALFWGLISAVAVMIYTLSPVGLIHRFGSTTVIGYGMLIGGVLSFFLLRWWTLSVTLDGAATLALAVIILVGTVLAFSMYLQSAADIGGVRAGLLSCTEMIVAPIASALWLRTSFHAADFVGFALMILMVVFLSFSESGAPKTAAVKNINNL